jgi:heterodisulfide reductase subunit A2
MIDTKERNVAVVGAGVAGMAVAVALKKSGIDVDLFERETTPGGHLKNWHALFPGRDSAGMILRGFLDETEVNNLNIQTNTEVISLSRENGLFRLITDRGEDRIYKAIVMANGFKLFDASRKEEYGYGIYPRVITSPELEKRLEDPSNGLLINGKPPGKVAFVHCVGSRDAKAGNHYCSKVCCITGVKQAISVKELYPECEVMNFYMDLRMFGMGYEELYQEAQEVFGITFIRGRVSEASPTLKGTVQVKAEDTLLGMPLKVNVDWLILLVGMEPDNQSRKLAETAGLQCEESGFYSGKNNFLQPGYSTTEGIFLAGTCAGPASIPESVLQGRAAAGSVVQYLSQKDE